MSLGSLMKPNRLGSFTVVKSNPGTTKVRFTITDTANLITTTKMVRAIIVDAFNQFLAAEAADLVSNGDGDIGESDLVFTFDSKYAEVTLTALTSIASSGNITASAPFADV